MGTTAHSRDTRLLADGLAGPTSVHRETEEAGFDVELDIEVQDGRYVCRTLTVRQREGGPPVTTEAVRDIPVQRLVKAAVAPYFLQGEVRDGVERVEPPRRPEVLDRRKPSEEALRYVAFLYRAAYLVGDPPTGSVAEALDVSRATASRWVADARERGFLGATEERKAGETVAQQVVEEALEIAAWLLQEAEHSEEEAVE